MNKNSGINAIFESIKENPISEYSPDGSLPLTENNVPDFVRKAQGLMKNLPKVSSGTVGLTSTPESGVVSGEFTPKPTPTPKRRVVQEEQTYGVYNPNTDLSYDDELLPGEKPIPSTTPFLREKQNFVRPNQVKQVLQEMAQPIQQQIPQSGGVDYSIIKLLIENAISNEFEKRFPKEVDFITIGKTIKFVDKNYNVYEGVLKKTGNLNEK